METNVHLISKPFESQKILLLSDIHWDNPKCNRDLLVKHLEQAVKINADILINGDTFCLMQGAYDPRKNKADIRPEHNKSNYLDAVVNTAIKFFRPYAHLIRVVGYGNHETNILKRQETDVIRRFVEGLNSEMGTEIKIGGYGGWIIYKFTRNKSKSSVSFKLKYFHGSGGGGPVTKGSIQFNRMATMLEGADLIWMGHVHESQELIYTVERINQFNRVELRDILMVRTPTYKEEYNEGKYGWHVERGAPPKPLGGRWLELAPERITSIDGAKVDICKIHAATYKTN